MNFEEVSGNWRFQSDGSRKGITDSGESARTVVGDETDADVEIKAIVKIHAGAMGCLIANRKWVETDEVWIEQYLALIVDPSTGSITLYQVTRDENGVCIGFVPVSWKQDLALAFDTTYHLKLKNVTFSDGAKAIYGYLDNFMVVQLSELSALWSTGQRGMEVLGAKDSYAEFWFNR